MANIPNPGFAATSNQAPLPTLFIPHSGGPCFFMDWTMGPADTWNKMADFLKGIDASLGRRPKAVLVVSGHWEEPAFTVDSGERPFLIYDYAGFPPHTYQLKYPAPGSPALAQRVLELLAGGRNSGGGRPATGMGPWRLHSLQADLSRRRRPHSSAFTKIRTRSGGPSCRRACPRAVAK